MKTALRYTLGTLATILLTSLTGQAAQAQFDLGKAISRAQGAARQKGKRVVRELAKPKRGGWSPPNPSPYPQPCPTPLPRPVCPPKPRPVCPPPRPVCPPPAPVCPPPQVVPPHPGPTLPPQPIEPAPEPARPAVMCGETLTLHLSGLGWQPGRVVLTIGPLELLADVAEWSPAGVKVRMPRMRLEKPAPATLVIQGASGDVIGAMQVELVPELTGPQPIQITRN